MSACAQPFLKLYHVLHRMQLVKVGDNKYVCANCHHSFSRLFSALRDELINIIVTHLCPQRWDLCKYWARFSSRLLLSKCNCFALFLSQLYITSVYHLKPWKIRLKKEEKIAWYNTLYIIYYIWWTVRTVPFYAATIRLLTNMYVLAVTRWTRQITKGPEQSSRYLRMLVKKKTNTAWTWQGCSGNPQSAGKDAVDILCHSRDWRGGGGGGGGGVTFDNSFMVTLMLNIIYPGNELGLNIALTTTRKAMRKRICVIGCCSQSRTLKSWAWRSR